MTTPEPTTTATKAAEPVDRIQPAARRRIWPRFELSGTQLIATALAAITATVAGSYLGVSGTVLGAAVASVLSAIGNAVYGHSLRSTRDRVREVVPVSRYSSRPAPTTTLPVVADEQPPVLPARPTPPTPRPRRETNPWRRVAIGAVTVFAAVLAIITGVEIIAGRPVSDLVRGDSGSGTSLFGTAGQGGGGGAGATPTVTKTVIPSVVVTTPTVTQTAPAVTRTVTPPASTSPSSPASPSETGSTSTGTTTPSTPAPPLG